MYEGRGEGGFWSPVSIACPNYDLMGSKPQAVANPEPSLCTSSQRHFKPPLRQIMHTGDKTNN